ncbi:ABC transporter substrate-binding protein [Ignavibacterium sp.]|uniref:ABC transporter substrate-binding protein n=1 Tax=Ignavibacterium sp. TaxID=2651167 RepID=UPI00307F0CBA
MKKIISISLISLLSLIIFASCNKKVKEENISNLNWEKIVEKAKGSELTLMMWSGDPFINAYMNNYVIPEVKNKFGIILNISEGQGSKIVQILMAEKEAGKNKSELDMMWINGETFYQLRQIDALFGPFLEKLPNSELIDFNNPFIKYDFQQPIDGMECPWGNVQLAIIYDSLKVTDPPETMEELESFVKNNSGVFTIPTEFTGMTLLKSMLIAIAGGQEELNGDFDETKYNKYSAKLWEYINRIKPYFWKEGKTFPPTLAQTHQMFASGELYFTFSNNDSEVDNKVLLGLFPNTSRSYVLKTGTIQNSHYMGIVKNSSNKAAAMVVCNFLISPEAQLKKMNPEVWGDGTILDINKLSDDYQNKFKNIPQRKYSLKRDSIQSKALMELAPEYMIRLYSDFRKYVIEK